MATWETHEGLLAQAIPNFGRRVFTNISNSKQTYTFLPAMQGRAQYATDNKLRWGLPNVVEAGGGTTFTFNVQVAKGNTFQWVRETTPINVVRRDYQKQVSLPWRMCRTHWSINMREAGACKGAEELTDLMTSRRIGDDQDWADSFEEFGWGAPPASTNEEMAFPLRYWVFCQPETVGAPAYSGDFAGNGAFVNLNHADYTSGPAGLSRVTYPMWGNWNFQYTTFNTDCVDKIAHAVLATEFHAPVEHPDKIKGTPDRAMYTGKANYITRGKLARQQNDQNTSDLLARMTENVISRIPMYYVPQIDSITMYSSANKSPIFGFNWATWYLATKSDFTMKDQLFPPDRSAPLDTTHARWLETQLVCCSPRENWVATT